MDMEEKELEQFFKDTDDIVSTLMEMDSRQLGVFISLFAYRFIQTRDITKEEFFKSLKTSLKRIEKADIDNKLNN